MTRQQLAEYFIYDYGNTDEFLRVMDDPKERDAAVEFYFSHKWFKSRAAARRFVNETCQRAKESL